MGYFKTIGLHQLYLKFSNYQGMGYRRIEHLQHIRSRAISAKGQPFKLQAVLDYRSEQLTTAQQDVAVEEHKKQVILQQLQQYDKTIAETIETQSRSLVDEGPVNLEQLQQLPSYLLRLNQERGQVFNQLHAQEQKLTVARDRLKDAHIKQKALEILKEKHIRAVRQKMDKADETMMNEIALNRAFRQ